MNIAENIHYLRKRDKITQEELADRLGVSRQSVSKWETGEAYPDTDKLVVLCDVFGVSLDALLRTDLTAETVEGEAQVQPEGDFGYVEHMNKFSKCMAAGVFLILFGVALCVTIAGLAISAAGYAPLLEVLSGVVVLAFVAAAVFLFIFYGMKNENFKKEHPEVGNVFEESEIRKFNKKFSLAMALLVSGILVDVIYLIIASTLIDAGSAVVTTTTDKDGLYCYATAVFLAVLSFIVGGLVYFGIQHTKYNVEEYNKQSVRNPKRSKLAEAISGTVMLTATAVFLVLGFVGGWWHPGWVVFPVGGIICGIIQKIMNARGE